MEVTIYEFSTGIQVEGTPDNWYSTGFTGEYMDRTIDPIPKAVIKAIDNKLFAIKSVHSLNEPALIAREVIGESGDEWSVVAVLSRREDDCQRPVLLHRYFLCPGLGNIDNILDWFKEYEPNNPQKIPTFDHFYAKRGVYNFQTKSTHIKIRDRRETELQQSCPIIIDYRDSSCTHIIVNAIAKEKNELDNQGNDREILPFSPANDYWGGSSISSRASLPQKLRDSLNNQEYVNNNESRKIIENTRDVKLISWAYNVPELERVMSFMVIKPADQNAKIGMSTIKQAPPPPPPSLVDENELKRTIGQWMGTSEKVSFESLEALEVALLRADPGDINNIKFWNHLLGGLGLNDFKNGNNYPALGKLLVVQAIIFPDEISKTLIWLRDNKNQKNYEQSCLDFQARLANVLKENPKKFETIKGRCTSGVEKLIFKVNDNHARLSLLANGIWADRVEDYLKVNYNYDNHTTTTNIKNLKSQYIDTLELKKDPTQLIQLQDNFLKKMSSIYHFKEEQRHFWLILRALYKAKKYPTVKIGSQFFSDLAKLTPKNENIFIDKKRHNRIKIYDDFLEKKLTLLDIYKQTLNQLFALIAKHYLSFIIGSFSLLLLMGFCIGFLTSTHIVFYDKQPQNNNKNSPSDLSQSDSINKLAQKISSEILNSADPNKMSKLENIKILAPNNRKIYVKDTENLKKILEIYVKETKKQDLKENVQKPTGSDEYKNKYKDIKCKVASEINIKKVTDCST